MSERHNLTPNDPIWRYVDYWPPTGRPQVPLILLRAELERALGENSSPPPVWLSDALWSVVVRLVEQNAPGGVDSVLEDQELLELLEKAFLDHAVKKMAAQVSDLEGLQTLIGWLEDRLQTLMRLREQLQDQIRRYSSAEHSFQMELVERVGKPQPVLLGQPIGALLREAYGLKEGRTLLCAGEFSFTLRGALLHVAWKNYAGRKIPSDWSLKAMLITLCQVLQRPVERQLRRLEAMMEVLSFRRKLADLLRWHFELFGYAAEGSPEFDADLHSRLQNREERMRLINEWVVAEYTEKYKEDKNVRLPRGFWKACLDRLKHAWGKAGLHPESFPYCNAQSLKSDYHRWANQPAGRSRAANR